MIVALAFLMISTSAPSDAFRMDNLKSNDGDGTDCYLKLWRKGKTNEPVLRVAGDRAWVRINGNLYALRSVAEDATEAKHLQTFEAQFLKGPNGASVAPLRIQVAIAPSSKLQPLENGAYSGQLQVSFKNEIKHLEVHGSASCPAGEID
jgi:hypothetical protein